ncbi:MAG: chemotaxis protein CheA [Bacillota bacterium]|nr:chemotaxis protein CheA [Bacillota bacterium]
MSETFPFTEDDFAVFLAEGEELVAALEAALLAMEASFRQGQVPDPEVVAAAFRAAHTLKGSSAAVGLRALSALTHAMESVLDGVRRGAMLSGGELDLLLRALDHIRGQLARLSEVLGEGGQEALVRVGGEEDPRAGELVHLLTGARSAPGEGDRMRGTSDRVLQVEVRFHEECPMPAVRAYQVVMALEDVGEILESDPSLEDIEGERVDRGLRVILETTLPPDQIRARLEGISDVAGVMVDARDDAPAGRGGVPREGGTVPGDGGGVPREGGAGSGGAGGLGEVAIAPGAGGLLRSVRVDVRVLDELMNLAGELVIQRTRLGRLLSDAQLQDDDLERAVEDIGRVATQLQEQVMKTRMLPLENLFRRFPRMVRDLAAAAGKEVNLVVRGERTELDRAVMEEIGDPLVHILRNAVDHGLESPAEREAVGKPRGGTIVLEAQHEENYVLISVRDDGRGIDVERVRGKAIAAGLVSVDEARELADPDVISFIFAPGFSTSDRVTEVSGRGVGLDVVRRNVQRVGGTLEVDSRPGQGAEFRMRLPLTLAIIRCLLCQWGDEIYALPLGHVDEVAEVDPEGLPTVYQKKVLLVRGNAVPFVPLGDVLGSEPAAIGFAVVVRAAGRQAALGVTGLLGDQEVVVKDLGAWLGNVRGTAGATILGDGRVALILDVAAVLRSRTRAPAA